MKEILDTYNLKAEECGLKEYSFGSLEEQLEAVMKDGCCIGYIQNPSEEVQLQAVKQNGNCIRFIQNPSERVQLAAVKGTGKLFANITSEKVIQYFCKNRVMRKALE